MDPPKVWDNLTETGQNIHNICTPVVQMIDHHSLSNPDRLLNGTASSSIDDGQSGGDDDVGSSMAAARQSSRLPLPDIGL